MKRIRRVFTLLEITIALVIIGFIGALTGIQVKKMISAHRFEEEVAALYFALQEAQLLSTAFQTDLALDFFIKEGKLAYRISTDEPFTQHQLNQTPRSLSHIATLQFKDAPTTSLHFDIYAGGRIEPLGVLAFCETTDNGKTLWFDLQNGGLIKFAQKKPILLKRSIPALPK